MPETQPVNPWEPEIRRFEELDRHDPPPERAVLLVGSSSIGFWPDPEEDFKPMRVIRRGFGGCGISDVLHFADRIVLRYRPRSVVVYAGDNDIAAGRTPEQVCEDFRDLVNKVRRALPDTRICFVSIKPSPSRAGLWKEMTRANDLIKSCARCGEKVVYIDVTAAMLTEEGRPREELFTPDMLHMNAEGYVVWTRILRPILLAD